MTGRPASRGVPLGLGTGVPGCCPMEGTGPCLGEPTPGGAGSKSLGLHLPAWNPQPHLLSRVGLWPPLGRAGLLPWRLGCLVLIEGPRAQSTPRCHLLGEPAADLLEAGPAGRCLGAGKKTHRDRGDVRHCQAGMEEPRFSWGGVPDLASGGLASGLSWARAGATCFPGPGSTFIHLIAAILRSWTKFWAWRDKSNLVSASVTFPGYYGRQVSTLTRKAKALWNP